MSQEPSPTVTAQLDALLLVVARHPRSAVTVRLSNDGSGTVRLEIKGLDGSGWLAALTGAVGSREGDGA